MMSLRQLPVMEAFDRADPIAPVPNSGSRCEDQDGQDAASAEPVGREVDDDVAGHIDTL